MAEGLGADFLHHFPSRRLIALLCREALDGSREPVRIVSIMNKLLWGSCGVVFLGALVGCGQAMPEDEALDLETATAPLSCSLYSENFDDGVADETLSGAYQVRWCDTYLPLSSNTPLCMLGRTLRTNSSTQNPTLWVNKGASSCTGVRVAYQYYQFATANVSLVYRQSNDATQVCPTSGVFTTAGSHLTTQACASQSVLIPFGSAQGVYIRLQHGSGTNALWVDNVTLTLEGCTSC
jgi:hypothetical protein